MKKVKIAVVLVLFIVAILSFSALADKNLGIKCVQTADCVKACPAKQSCYCSGFTKTCMMKTAVAGDQKTNKTNTSTTGNSQTTPSKDTDVVLNSKVSNVEAKLAILEQKVAVDSTANTDLQKQIQSINDNLRQLVQKQGQTEDSLGKQISSVSTGLAAIQEDIKETRTNVSALQQQINEFKEGGSGFWIIGILIIAGLIGGIWYMKKNKTKNNTYSNNNQQVRRSSMGRSQNVSSSNHPVMDYITKHIKQGKNFFHIKENLMKAGWNADDINRAYHATVQRNYHSYKGAQASTSTTSQKTAPKRSASRSVSSEPEPTGNIPLHGDKKRMVVIGGLTLGLVILGFFFLSQTAGKAIHIQDSFANDAPFECTPPHIVTEGGCCLDENNNTKCDVEEAYDAERVDVSKESCSDHQECTIGQFCVNGKCQAYDEKDLYTQKTCQSKSCNINNIEIVTSDGETYLLHGKEGSYAAAGALRWTVRPLPNFCQGDSVKIPIEIIKTDVFCYDSLGTAISCDQEVDLACKSDADCAECKTTYGVSCICAESKGVCKKDVVASVGNKVVEREIITIGVGETSKIITHPNEGVNKKLGGFTLTANKVKEFCF